METGRKKVRLGELLVNSGVITAEQLQQALDNPNRQGKMNIDNDKRLIFI